MSRKKIRFKYKKERSLLSEMLPYEIPATLTNRHFYNFVNSNKIEFQDGKLSWKKDNETLNSIVLMLFSDSHDQSKICTEKKQTGPNEIEFNYLKLDKNKLSLIPFEYKINHKNNEFRNLSIPHPRSQLDVVSFYDKYKELIIYNCSQSPFSIRKPEKIASFKYFKDRTHYENLGSDNSPIEEKDKEYENLRSFFSYKEYSNIYKFYDSYKFHRCEKKYNKLLKLDITKCFDSIYTHSLSWALLEKTNVKENIKLSKSTFPGKFDTLISNLNYQETNGIIIGPEFCRIFAELILQSIDKKVYRKLKQGVHGIVHKVDYEIYRYVDDYFVFFNDDQHKDLITNTLQHHLKEYKLHLNSSKIVIYEKPIITEISIAKKKIAELIEEKVQYNLAEISKSDSETLTKGSIHINPQKLITNFKIIIKECDVEYKNILNYTLSTIETKSKKIFIAYSKTDKDNHSEKNFTKAIRAILEFTFFIYSSSPRVNSTIKLCRILNIFCEFLSSPIINEDSRNNIFKYIFDETRFALERNKVNEYVQVETSYLLTFLNELGRNFWLEEILLARYFNILVNKEGKFHSAHNLNFLSITVLLYYMKNKKRYNSLRSYIIEEIKKIFHIQNSEKVRQNCEKTMLFFDTISCPYIPDELKINLLESQGITDYQLQQDFIKYKNHNGKKQLWFTTWENFNFGKELDTKQSQEVY